jgi:type I restriction-modification system DNA methylase subunit
MCKLIGIPQVNGDLAWVQHIIKSMNSAGRMSVVLPHGAFFYNIIFKSI